MKTCQDYYELISRFVDNDLTSAEKEKLAVHLAECEHCSRHLEALTLMREQAGLLEEEPPEGFAEGVMYKIGLEHKKRGFLESDILPLPRRR